MDIVADLKARAKPWPRGNRFEDFAVGSVFHHHWGRTLISQCLEGAVAFGQYATDHRLKSAGVVSGGGMTREVALAKLSILLGAGLPASVCRDWMGVSVFGEL